MIFQSDWYSGWWWYIIILSLTDQRYRPGKHSLKFRTSTVTLTLNTAKQPFHKTLKHMHCETKLVPIDINSSEHILEIVKISLYEPKLGYCDLDFEDSKIQTQKGSNERLFIFTRTHSMHIFGEIPFLKIATNFSHSLAYHHTGFAYKRFSDS